MRAVIALALVLIGAPAFADGSDVMITVPASMLSPRMQPDARLALRVTNDDALASARRMRTAGLVLALVGTAAIIVGPIVGTLNSSDGAVTTMVTLPTLGTLSLIAGIPMWAAGQNRANERERARVFLTPNGIAF